MDKGVLNPSHYCPGMDPGRILKQECHANPSIEADATLKLTERERAEEKT